jgi:hypothetical protein
MYAASISVIGVQITVANVYDIELVTLVDVYDITGETIIYPKDTPITSSIVGFLQQGTFNQRATNIVQANFTGNTTYYDRVETFLTGTAFVAWELVQLLSGTYIFNLLYLLGMPLIFVTGFLMLYLLLLARAVIGYVRGV